jgi:hypothetical protein
MREFSRLRRGKVTGKNQRRDTAAREEKKKYRGDPIPEPID